MTILITGGAGFIGSHLVDNFIERGEKVRVFDNQSTGTASNLERWLENPNYEFIEDDLLNLDSVKKALDDCSVVYHLAANPEVRSSKAHPHDHFKQNIEATFNLLEAIRIDGSIEKVVFTSTSTVYGDATILPTPEDYVPLRPISHYGSSKLASEVLINSYASMYGIQSIIYRMANIVGPRSNHGVTYDFVEKLKKNPRELEVLGDGSQSKSYLYVEDCVEGIILGAEKSDERVEILNIGSRDRVNVLEIANIVIEEMGLSDVEIKLMGGVDGGRGWKGDVKFMQLDVSKLRSLDWEPKFNSAQAVRITARALTQDSEESDAFK